MRPSQIYSTHCWYLTNLLISEDLKSRLDSSAIVDEKCASLADFGLVDGIALEACCSLSDKNLGLRLGLRLGLADGLLAGLGVGLGLTEVREASDIVR